MCVCTRVGAQCTQPWLSAGLPVSDSFKMIPEFCCGSCRVCRRARLLLWVTPGDVALVGRNEKVLSFIGRPSGG